jgi:hypothetical protein
MLVKLLLVTSVVDQGANPQTKPRKERQNFSEYTNLLQDETCTYVIDSCDIGFEFVRGPEKIIPDLLRPKSSDRNNNTCQYLKIEVNLC